MRPLMMMTRALSVAIALAASAEAAGAQLANASTAATGLAGAYTARAQGYNAVYWNPANLGMPGNPGFSLTFGAFDGQTGLRPIDLSKFAPYSGKLIPSTVREQWMLDVEAEGAQRGNLGGGVTEFGMSIGSLAVQVNTKLASNMDLSPGMTEAILFANAGRDSVNNTRHDLDLAGTGLRGSVYTTGGLSYAFGLPLVPLPNFKLGVTGKYIYGHGLVLMQDESSTVASDINIDFPAITTDSATLDGAKRSGRGIGLDHEFAYSLAPAALKDQVVAQKFKPVLAAGLSFDWLPRITVSADIRQQVGGGIEQGPESMVAAGAEVRWIPFVPLRGGVQMMTGGFGVAGGVGLHLLGFEAGIAGYVRTRNGSQESGATINVLSIRP